MPHINLNPFLKQDTRREYMRQVLLDYTVLMEAGARAVLVDTQALDEVDLSAYGGAVGDRITIRTRRGFGVAAVRVCLADEHGSEIESGQAAEVPPCSNSWVYFATRRVPRGSALRISVSSAVQHGLAPASQQANQPL